jgi:hypothetical protein
MDQVCPGPDSEPVMVDLINYNSGPGTIDSQKLFSDKDDNLDQKSVVQTSNGSSGKPQAFPISQKAEKSLNTSRSHAVGM